MTDIFVLEMFEKFQFSVGPLGEYRGAERFHDLLDRDRLAGELIFGRAVIWSTSPLWTLGDMIKSCSPHQPKCAHSDRL